MEPVEVTGNEGESESGSGSEPTPHSQEREHMTAVEGCFDGVGLLVVQWQETPSELARRGLGNLIIGRLRSLFRSVAGRFTETARGSLRYEDLEQVAAIEAFKFFSKYDHSKVNGSGSTFEQHVYRRALKACVDYVALHSKDVRPGRDATRGAQGWKNNYTRNETRCHVQSRDAQRVQYNPESFDGAGELDNGASAYSLARRGAIEVDDTPERSLEDAQVRAGLLEALSRLSPEKRDIIRDHFGIGRDGETSLRSLSALYSVPRSKLAFDLNEAIKDLRREARRCL